MTADPLFEIKDVDKRFYEERIRDFLPDTLIDVHAHVWLSRFRAAQADEPLRAVTWPARVARDNPVEDLIETYRLLFPGKSVKALIFGNILSRRDDVDGTNAYVRDAAAQHGFSGLLFSLPTWDAAEFEQRLIAGGFLGAKSYLSLSDTYLPEKEIRIFDFFPHHQLGVLDRRGGILLLHIPRDGRLRDPVNLAQMLEIEQRYPRIKVIVAHVGRAYCDEDVGDAFRALAPTRNMCFDISANTNAEVFAQLLEAVGPKRVLFGSDLPILRMRMRRVCEGGNYVNLVPRGLYGDVRSDGHMREIDGAEAQALTFFMYEEIAAFRSAAERAGLTRADLDDVFHHNAARLIEGARPAPVVVQLQMVWPAGRLPVPPVTLPAGYSVRTYRSGDEEGYTRVMHSGGFTYWSPASIQAALRAALPDGLFFAVETASGRIVATAVANHGPSDLHPYGGELGWVAADVAHRGKGLGRAVCAAVLNRLVSAGYRDIYLKTDDFRLAAIKTYLGLGLEPLLFAPDMQARWADVHRKLGRVMP